jgi:hypothetical protein
MLVELHFISLSVKFCNGLSAKLIFIFSKFKIGCKSLKWQKKNFVLKQRCSSLVTAQLPENSETCVGLDDAEGSRQ